MERFRRMVNSKDIVHPALIMVDEASSDPQLSYIINPPDLQGEVLVCRKPLQSETLHQLQQIFSDRTCYLFHPETFTVQLLPEEK